MLTTKYKKKKCVKSCSKRKGIEFKTCIFDLK